MRALSRSTAGPRIPRGLPRGGEDRDRRHGTERPALRNPEVIPLPKGAIYSHRAHWPAGMQNALDSLVRLRNRRLRNCTDFRLSARCAPEFAGRTSSRHRSEFTEEMQP